MGIATPLGKSTPAPSRGGPELQLEQYLTVNGLLPCHQSAYRCYVTANLTAAVSHWWSLAGPGVVGGFMGQTAGCWTDHCHRFIAYCDQI